MQGVLYFPFIEVPASAWWTRTMLYWDDVATIVPRAYLDSPAMHDPYTLELIKDGLLRQTLPEGAGALGSTFGRYLTELDADEISARRRRFERGKVTRVHEDKFLTYEAGLTWLQDLGLARFDHSAHESWVVVEAETAAEFMAALAMALCERRFWPADHDEHVTWVPTTDRQEAVDALLAGLTPDGRRGEAARVRVRIHGELRAAELRADLLERLLPVPDEVVSNEKILKFRKQHGHLLPALRRYIEDKLDTALSTSDEDLRLRLLDRVAEEVEERIQQAKAYLGESGFRKVSRSSLLRVCKVIPGVGDYAGNVKDVADSLQTNADFESQPLAYLAFARTTFGASREMLRVDPWTGIPLIEAMSDPIDE